MAGAQDNRRLVEEARQIARQAQELLASASGDAAGVARAAAKRLLDEGWTVLVSGLRSTGKSSLVCSLWGDSGLLPTAVRDCTQTNTLVRVPGAGEEDRRIVLRFLDREEAVGFALRDLAYHRLEEVIREVAGLLGQRLDAMPPDERIRWAVSTVRRLFEERPDVHVLHEPATEQVEKLEQFIEFIDSPAYRSGGAVEMPWSERREYLMGRRRPDGRTLEVGKLLSLRLVELVRATGRWGDSPPHLVDSPWIPTFHNARRADLILREAESADVLVIVALPEAFELEPWVDTAFRARPRLAARTVVVFNQVDTLDTSELFRRGGFAEAWRANLDMLTRRGVRPRNVLCSCARLPFLEGLPADTQQSAFEAERSARLRAVLARIRKVLAGRSADELTDRLAAACDPADSGVESLRSKLLEMSRADVPAARAREAAEAIAAVADVEFEGGGARAWKTLRERAAALSRALHDVSPAEVVPGDGKVRRLPDGRPLFRS